MNEVEKMYRNAHVYSRVYGDITKETFENKVFNMGDMCNEAFTAEKQLELIKWLLEKWMDVRFVHNLDGIYYISSFNNVSYIEKNFEECIASFVNNAWQDLAEEERKQIKEILE